MGAMTDSERELITQAVAAAESETAGEIVTVLANRSDGYSDIQLGWAILAAITALAVVAMFPDFYLPKVDWMLDGWNHEWTPRASLTLAAIIAIAKFVSVWLILLWQPLRMLLVPSPVKSARVRERAVALFKVGAERRTHGRTGILIYLSMQEHRAEIVADEAIAAIVPAEVWGEAMADMLAEIKQGRVAHGLAAGIRDVGIVLAEHFPRADDDVNELPDRLIEV